MTALNYIKEIKKIIDVVEKKEAVNIKKAAELLVDTIKAGGLVHVFGCGHSQILAEEVFYRAGGLAVMSPLFDPGVALHYGAVRSTKNERLEGYARSILAGYNLESRDLLLVVSNSGRNAVPVEMALEAKERGLRVIALSSREYAKKSNPRHSSGQRLIDIADMVLDNATPFGDALLDYGSTRAVPGSTVAGALVLNSVLAETLHMLQEEGRELPVYKSGNIDGADVENKKTMEKYRHRIKYL